MTVSAELTRLLLARLPSVAEGKPGVGERRGSPSYPICPGLIPFKAVFFFRE